MPTDKILVVDDDPEVRNILSIVFRDAGFNVTEASDGTSALEMITKNVFSVAIVDLNMPGLPANQLIQMMKLDDPDMEIIVFTGYPTVESSIEAIQSQVADYICKPSDNATIVRSVRRAIERRQLILDKRELIRELEVERNRLKQEVTAAKLVIERRLEDSHEFVGNSEAIKQIRHSIAQVAPTDMTVLILGDSGTGKGVVARLIHDLSGRDPNAFVKINCPAIPETLLESELFGHEPGAFTGAERRKPGRFELASGGTIFLDEIGDLPLRLQGKLLQVIEQKRFTRLGGNETVDVDVRIIAATNAPIEKMVAERRFRRDIFYRLNEYTIELPPLHERNEDIPLLVKHFCNLYGNRYGNLDLTVTPEMTSFLARKKWPGNVRELESAIRRIALDGNGDAIEKSRGDTRINNGSQGVADVVRNTEIQAILTALDKTRWNRREAAKMLEMSYSSLRRRIEKYDLKME